MIIAGSIEPGIVVERSHVNDQRVALPSAIRPSHPGVDWSLPMRIHIYGARGTLVFINDQDFRRSLENLKRKRHVIRSWHARPITLELRFAGVIAMRIVGYLHGHSIFEILFLFRLRFRPVRNLAAYDD